MDKALVNIEHFRSRERIKDLGEVFTPEAYVIQMLDLIDSKTWSDENAIFFEPSAGHGNIVLPILARRAEALRKKFKRSNERETNLCALATALNTTWAIDICSKNVEHLRARVFGFVVHALLAGGKNISSVKMIDFLAHVLCTLLWQFSENEALSALSNSHSALLEASKTKLGREWIKRNKHSPLNFNNDWCTHFKDQQNQKITPLVFVRAKKFLESILFEQTTRGYSEFNFAKSILESALVDDSNVSGVA